MVSDFKGCIKCGKPPMYKMEVDGISFTIIWDEELLLCMEHWEFIRAYINVPI